MIEIKHIVQAYFSQRMSFFEREEYKWKAVNSFHENYFRTDLAFEERLNRSFMVADNLLASSNYYPARMLYFFAKEKTDRVQNGLDLLYNLDIPVKERVSAFMSDIEDVFRTLQQGGYRDWKGRTNVQSFQDTHAVSVYLALRYPNNYYFYKWSVFKTAAEKLGYTIVSKDKVDKLVEFYDFCEEIKKELLKEKESISDYNKFLKKKGYADYNYNLLTQDFVYAVARYLNADAFKKAKSIVKNERTEKTSHFSTAVAEIEKEFKGKKGIDYSKQDALNRSLGIDGEMWVVNYEKERLAKLNINHEVRHASIMDGDGIGYDILSVEDDGKTPRYIEVKTTTGGVGQPFFFSKRELERSMVDANHYYLYRVYNYKDTTHHADVLILNGSLEDLNATPISYKVSIDK